jgi:hypothetical protein
MRTIAVLLLVTACVAFGGVAFGVNPIGPTREVYAGYRIGPVVPQLSVDYGSLNGSLEYRDEDNDEEYSGKVRMSVLTPSVGTKLIFGNSDLKPFARASLGIPILSFKLDLDLDEYDEDEALIEDFVDIIKEGLGQPFIFAGGAGVEYFFADRFSIGGELKYRLLTAGGKWEFTEDDLTYWNGSIDLGGSIAGTSSALWLNYYF